MKRILQGSLLLAWYMIAVHASDQESLKEAVEMKKTIEKKEAPKNESFGKKPVKIEKQKPIPAIQSMLFVNARVNEIILIITDHKNKQIAIPIKMGKHHLYQYNYSPTKIICHEKLTPKTSVSKNELETYTVFVFNDNQKTDKYHHISIHEKNNALKHARKSGDITLFNDVCEETIYNP